MLRGRRRAPRGSRIAAQSEAPSGNDSYCANPTAGVDVEQTLPSMRGTSQLAAYRAKIVGQPVEAKV
jgi:hypothetical protein